MEVWYHVDMHIHFGHEVVTCGHAYYFRTCKINMHQKLKHEV
jgi:hypothetical protein